MLRVPSFYFAPKFTVIKLHKSYSESATEIHFPFRLFIPLKLHTQPDCTRTFKQLIFKYMGLFDENPQGYESPLNEQCPESWEAIRLVGARNVRTPDSGIRTLCCPSQSNGSNVDPAEGRAKHKGKMMHSSLLVSDGEQTLSRCIRGTRAVGP